jgi:hypothetical protein
LKLSHTAYDIEALGILFKHGEWGVEVTIECLENVAEKKNQFGLPYGMFRSKATLNPGRSLEQELLSESVKNKKISVI